MKRVADILVEFDPAQSTPTSKVDRSEITVEVLGGPTQVITIGPDESHIKIEVQASSTIVITSKTFDQDNEVSTSVVFTYVVPDGEGPIPLTNFRASVLGFRDVDDEPVPPEPEPAPAPQ